LKVVLRSIQETALKFKSLLGALGRHRELQAARAAFVFSVVASRADPNGDRRPDGGSTTA